MWHTGTAGTGSGGRARLGRRAKSARRKAWSAAACATAVAAARLKRANRTVQITLPGGDLTIEWRDRDDHVLMTGPAAFEYEGQFDPALFAPIT